MLTIAVSSRALFRMDRSHEVFLEGGPAAFEKFQRENENVPLEPGVAFPLVKKLLGLNSPGKRDRVEVVLLSRNSPDAGMRVMRSISEYGIDIERAIFTQGLDRFRWARALKTDLFLSVNSDDVRTALENGVAAAAMLPHGSSELVLERDPPNVFVDYGNSKNEGTVLVEDVNVAFDGDSVLFSDAAERVYQKLGLATFQQTEREQAAVPLPDGPFRALLTKLSNLQKELLALQKKLDDERQDGQERVRIALLKIALVTARGIPAQERVLKTLRSWGINIDVAAFCGGLPKGPFLEAFEADIFFDDTMKHCESAASSRIPAGHVVHGIANEVRTAGAGETAAA